MSIKPIIFEEPELEFGEGYRHQDPRQGLVNAGPHQVALGESLSIGIVGSAATTEKAVTFLEEIAAGVDAKDSTLPNLHQPFPGLGNANPFRVRFDLPEDARRALSKSVVESICKEVSDERAVEAAVTACVEGMTELAQSSSKPDIILLPLSIKLIERLVNARSRNRQKADKEDSGGSSAPDFRALLKARARHLPFGFQIVWEDVLDEKVKVPRRLKEAANRQIQHKAARAWNLLNSLYFKATHRVPYRRWVPDDALKACYIGLSFYRDLTGQQLYTSSAQMFDERGKGYILRGKRALTESCGRRPYMAEEDARQLVRQVLTAYRTEHRHSPARVMILKTSRFRQEEVDGISEALAEAGVELKDLVWIQERHPLRVFRDGSYPVLRGTFIDIGQRGLLYTQGSIPYLGTYPGVYVPNPLLICPHDVSESTVTDIAREIFSLTKVNWNSTAMNQRHPAPLRAARKVGEVLKYLSEDDDVSPEYWRYM